MWVHGRFPTRGAIIPLWYDFIALIFMPSSVILHKEYFAERKVLRVTFVTGLVYDYLDVPPEIYAEMKKAKSKGTYFNRNIKGIYDFERVE